MISQTTLCLGLLDYAHLLPLTPLPPVLKTESSRQSPEDVLQCFLPSSDMGSLLSLLLNLPVPQPLHLENGSIISLILFSVRFE
jgi:hypothetical protein